MINGDIGNHLEGKPPFILAIMQNLWGNEVLHAAIAKYATKLSERKSFNV